jgi:D-alanyl-D-alanine carboxypeptidase
MIGRIALYSTLVASAVGFVLVLAVVTQVSITNQSQPALTVLPGSLSTDTWGIFNPETGEVLAGENVNEKHPIASVTKLFTAYAVMENEHKYEPFTLTFGDVSTEGRSGKLFYGEKYTAYQLLFPLLIESSNDAGEALRRALGTEGTDAIESLKNELVLANTCIVDGSGLDGRSVSTVDDLAKFYAYLRKTHPHILDITQLRVYINSHTGYVNNNPARTFESFTGGKNGYTPEAGRTFAGTFATSGTEGEVGIVLLGSTDVVKDITAILSLSKGSGM